MESSQERRRDAPCPATSRSAPTWGLFVKYGVRRQYRSGEVLLEKGALSAQAGFLVKGQLRTFCLGPSGDEISLFYLGPGNLFGSSALVYHAKVMVSVSAISPAEVYLLAADRFWKLWQEHGYPPQDLMAHFVRRITMLSDYICCSHFLEDDKRVAYFLHTCCASSGPSIPYTHEQIAAINEKVDAARKRMENGTSYLTSCLADFFATVPHKETKTTEKYRLLSGTLTFKKGTTKTKLDETKLVPWLKANGYGELVKVEESTRWADLKKLLSYTGDIATLTETGEIVEGVTVYETPGIFTVDV